MTDKFTKFIAISEIVGGVCGLVYSGYAAISSGFDLYIIWALPLFAIFGLMGVFAGIFLLRRQELGRKLSIVVQLIQLPKLASPYLIWMFSFGFDVFGQVLFANNQLNLGFQSRLLFDGQLILNRQGSPFLVGISVVSLISIYKLTTETFQSQVLDESQFPPLPGEYSGD